MTLQEFIQKNTGKKLDFDGAYQNQCVDLYRFYLRDVWKVPQTPGVVGAYQILNTLPSTFDKFTSGIPQAGDVIIWNEKQVKNGHVAVVVSAGANTFNAFQQNAPQPYQPCNIGAYPYKNVIGWFRPKTQLKTTFMQITVIANKINWLTSSHLSQLNDYFKLHSSGRMEVVADVKHTQFSSIPIAPFQGFNAVDINWYRSNITPLCAGQVSVFLMNPEDYNNGTNWGFMTYGDPNRPVRTELSSQDVLSPEGIPMFVLQTFHEICHALFFLTGQTDRTHEFIYPEQKPKELLDLIDYPKLQAKLITIKPTLMNQAKVVKSKNSPKVYVVYEMPSMEYLNTKASIEGFTIPAQLPNTDSL